MAFMLGIFRKVVLFAAALQLAAPGLAAAETTAVKNGRKLAEQMCANCHAISPSTAAGWTDAPSFESIANRPDATELKLSLGIQKPHIHMLYDQRPENEANVLAAYIMSLRGK